MIDGNSLAISSAQSFVKLKPEFYRSQEHPVLTMTKVTTVQNVPGHVEKIFSFAKPWNISW